MRALSATGDMTFGQGQKNFWVNQKQGVAQKVQTRLGLYVGDWFLSLSDGMTWRTDVLGLRTDSTRDPAIRARIQGTSGVVGISNYSSQLVRGTRDYTVSVSIDTAYGQTLVSTQVPGPNGDVRSSR
ncbi:hypothetical protein [Beijerinckia sp. L45]|uniref:hypothetical protein n=1 Tax=Beijerinckia sp. L45 TaxID=1641855 RepID=UPI001AED3FE8|nr:hypothetical protein [Beijerinckia sp. L45]